MLIFLLSASCKKDEDLRFFGGLFASNFESKARSFLNRHKNGAISLTKSQSKTLAEELKTLTDLYKTGSLSEEEFNKAKQKAINGAA
ncbi:MAG: hypothetical protein NZ480_03420 [Bdellovibrionaceae bacterium]|nr:hypothetical protein [Pseudobdellovibrionaceae bacterium]